MLGKLFDHRVRVPVADGKIRRRELRRCGLTDNDLFAHLRQRGIFTIDALRYVLYETKGTLTVVPGDVDPTSELVQAGLDGAAGYSTQRR